ncbi:hypothetical protein TNCV_3256961 [Trichonephila clavipes]|nr:hypothetical protein TNCV_3256961 [Trichonephila clavipes]
MPTPVPLPDALDYAGEDPWCEQPYLDGPTDSRLGLEVSRHIRKLPSDRWSIKRDLLENATCLHSVDVQLQYWSANSSLRDR